jgi:hypothetical protein
VYYFEVFLPFLGAVLQRISLPEGHFDMGSVLRMPNRLTKSRTLEASE